MTAAPPTGQKTIFITNRPLVHQDLALQAAPDELDITMLESPTTAEVERTIATLDPVFLISERTGEVSAEMIEAGPSLRLIQRLGSQIHDIDLDAARAADVPVCFWPLPQLTMVAEHVMMQMLSLVKRARPASAVVAEASNRWGEPRQCDADTFAINWSGFGGVRQLSGATIGIIGFGEIGTALSRLLQPFGASVLYHRRARLPDPAAERLGIGYADPDELLERSDIVVVLLPHSPETEGGIDASFIARMQPRSFLVSAGASTLLDEEAVAAGYRSGHLAGVAADGFRWEPVRPDNPLVLLAADPAANVTLTPHSAQADLVLDVDLRRHEFTNLDALLHGRPLQHRVGVDQ
jgi:phosphoglycerate dehydrogenase-like enzyme